MKMPPESTASATLLDSYGEYLLARLSAKKDLKALFEAFRVQQDTLRAKLTTANELNRAEQRALASRDDADQILDDAVRRLSMTILSITRNNRNSALYTKYFPGGLTAITLAPLPDEMIGVGKILDLLSTEENPQVKGFDTALKESSVNLKTAIDGYNGAKVATDTAVNAMRAQSITWRDTYRKIYGELTSLYPHDRSLVESFFKKAPKPKKGTNSKASAEGQC